MEQNSDSIVFIIDDNESVRRSLSLLLLSGGYQVLAFESISDLFQLKEIAEPGCIILDIFLGEESGLKLQDQVKEKFPHHPIIYITGHGDIPMSVQALRKGAINFLNINQCRGLAARYSGCLETDFIIVDHSKLQRHNGGFWHDPYPWSRRWMAGA